MSSMPPEQLAEMSKMSGVPGLDANSLAAMQRSMAAMSPQQMERMMRMSANMPASPEEMMKDPAAMAKMAEVGDSRGLTD